MMRMSTFVDDMELTGRAEVMGVREKSHRFPNGYDGTYIFKTKEDCEEFINKFSYNKDGFEPFGVDADWETETKPIGGSYKHHYLLVDKQYYPLPRERMLLANDD